ncbi:NADPH-dependent FMN reductase [Bacillus sp. AFS040349]|uniref:NADPH-dependent FMN reductase n=1 Tax=Bacillus sp. AFS040349 TaxID=2033502 RepID=UPI000BFB2946|nr:NADPH-dependent FMN reductase [Bacillus sp. AFS040349]PGT76582.1 FMN reductase (NADPH) [Bacillus sp. AFS040349]
MEKVVMISGSPSVYSRLNGLLDSLVMTLNKRMISVDYIRVCQLPAEDLLHANFNSDPIKNANSLVEQADTVIIATPVYQASFSGLLKSYLDLLPQKALENKKILPVAIGGSKAHLLMIEYSLKPVLSVLGATHIEKGIYVKDTQVFFNEEGKAEVEQEILNRFNQSINQLVCM